MDFFDIATICVLITTFILLAVNGYYHLVFKKHKTSFRLAASRFSKILPKANIILGAGIIGVLGYCLVFPAKVQAVSLHDNESWSDFSKPFEIVFDRPVKKGQVIHEFSKTIKGSWSFEKSSPLDIFKRKLVFYPEESLMPEDKVTIRTSFGSLLGFKEMQYQSTFISGAGKLIVKIDETVQDRQNVNPLQDFFISIPGTDPHSYIVEFVSNPPIELTAQPIQGDKIDVVHAVPFKNGQAYEIKVDLTPVTYNLKTKEKLQYGTKVEAATVKFEAAPSPLVKEITPKGENVLSTESIAITFDQEMDRDSVEKGIQITPATEVSFEWNEESTVVSVKPKNLLVKETTYTVALNDSIKSKYGAELVQDMTPRVPSTQSPMTLAANAIDLTERNSYTTKANFTTIGGVGVSGTTPGAGAGGVLTQTNISISFNQSVDKASAESKFTISPDVVGKFTWNGNTMTFNPDQDLAFSKKYSVSLGAGVKSIDGIDLKSSYSFSFTTKANKIILNVPYVAQNPQFACNVTAAAMALRYKGINVGQMDVYNYFANNGLVANSPKYYVGNHNAGDYPAGSEVWGDPNQYYVGNIYGEYGGDNSMGYGTHWNPIARAINSYKPGSAEAKVGWNTAGLLKEIDNNNPVIVWWQNGYASYTRLSWKTSGGGTVSALNGMHSEVVVGYEGSPENPTYIYLLDPWNRWGGYHKVSAAYFDNLWSSSFGRAAVVVR